MTLERVVVLRCDRCGNYSEPFKTQRASTVRYKLALANGTNGIPANTDRWQVRSPSGYGRDICPLCILDAYLEARERSPWQPAPLLHGRYSYGCEPRE